MTLRDKIYTLMGFVYWRCWGKGDDLDTQSLGKKRKIVSLEKAEWALPVKDFIDPLALIHLLNNVK